MKITNQMIVDNDDRITDFPAVVVEQTNVRISDIIRRNLAGEQVLGTSKLAYDFLGNEQFTNMDVNPFNKLDFDLDDLVVQADKVGMTIADLQDQKGRLDQEIAKKIADIKAAKEVDPVAQSQKLEEAK